VFQPKRKEKLGPSLPGSPGPDLLLQRQHLCETHRDCANIDSQLVRYKAIIK
jgi:glycerol-3-phosphate dehydrogenase